MGVKLEQKKNNHIFKRYEKKYLLDSPQYEKLFEGIRPYLAVDQYGESTICNLYYDTETFELIRTSIEKPEYKEKLRMRSYGIPRQDDTTFIEIKKKYDGIVYKRRIELPLCESAAYLDQGIAPSLDSQIKREIDFTLGRYGLSKKMYIAYDRTAMFGIFDDIFEEYTSSNCLDRVRTTNMGSMFELSYTIVMKNEKNQKAFLDQLRCRNGNLTIICQRPVVGKEEL